MNAENSVANATISASSTPVRQRAAKSLKPRGAPINNENPAKKDAMIATWSQMISMSPAYLPIRNSARDSGFDRIV